MDTTHRLALLARVSDELSSTLDAETAVTQLARIVVPALADWCVVTLVDESGTLYDAGDWHVDELFRAHVRRYAELRLLGISDDAPLMRAYSTGEMVVVEQDAAVALSRVMTTDEAKRLLEFLAPDSLIVVPLRARGRTVGVISAFRGVERGTFDVVERETVAQVATRAALVIDNAQLFAQQQRMAEDLQRSLLTDPPRLDQVEIAVRYFPARDAAQVGGDWYDSFVQTNGATVLVIGDVIGHDSVAAAAMGQLRGLLRGIGCHSGAAPAELLTGLDEAMEGLEVRTTATAVIARLEQNSDELEVGLTRLRWSNAGHPPPVVLDAEGKAAPLFGAGPELLLGIDPTAPRTNAEITLGWGATVVLYTDGLVERRGTSVDEGVVALCQVMSDLENATLDELCDGVIRRMLPPNAEDDVALIALRLRPPS